MNSRRDVSTRPLRRLGSLLLVPLLLHGCTDGGGPLAPEGERSATVGLVASWADLASLVENQTIDSVRVVVLEAETGQTLGSVVEAVPASGDSISVELELTFQSSSPPTVVITVELLYVDGSILRGAWSARSGPLSLDAGETNVVSISSLARGPLENLSVTDIALSHDVLQLGAGDTLRLVASLTTDGSGASPTLFWSSLDESVATVDAQGLVTAVTRGTTAVVAAAGYASDTVMVSVVPAGTVPTDPPPAWIFDYGTGLLQSDDDCDSVELGFTFTFYGVDYTGVWVNSNGNLTFNGCNTGYSNADVPSGTHVLVAPLYGDWDPGDGGDVYWNVIGSAPNRTFVATWLAVPEFSNPNHPGTSTFQVQLREGSNSIVFGYNTLTTDGINWTSGSQGDSDMEVGISSGTGSFIRSATGSEIPGLEGTNICYVVSAGEYSQVDCNATGAALTASGPESGGSAGWVIDADTDLDPEQREEHRARKRAEDLDRRGHRNP